jgi:hypothetical protein
MNTTHGKALWLALALVVVAGAAEADAQASYESPKGRVEVLGLRRWTLDMLRDSVRRYVPGQELHDAACMVTLRDSLHFADASVMWFMMAPPGAPPKNSLTIKVIEPDQKSRVQWNPRPGNEFSSLLPDYSSVVLPITDSVGGVWRGRFEFWLQFPDSASRERALADVPAAQRPDGERVYAFLAAHRSPADGRRAMRTLGRDGFWVNRMVAAAVLSNFPASDSTWWSLVHALRDPHEAVRGTARMSLASMPARPVDWRPVSSDIRLLIGGTNLPAMEDVFDVLSRTSVSPDLASVILRGNADWLLIHLGASSPMAADRAHRLLVQLNRGKDLGRTASAWTGWATGL